MESRKPAVIECFDLPHGPDITNIHRLLPKESEPQFYTERTDRNIGWITREEQELLRGSVVGIAGCGGMGGLVAQSMIRMGVGEVRIADTEVFDVSNINRQFGAMKSTVGKSKGLETARLMREIADDTTVAVYSEGITERTARHFLDGCDLVCDEIEVLAVGARVLLHQEARLLRVPLFNCNSVGFRTFLFLFTHSSMTMEELLGLSYQEARNLETLCRQGSRDARNTITERMLAGVVPLPPSYTSDDWAVLQERLKEESKASIVGTNPLFAAGFLANRVILYLLKDSPRQRDITEIPEMPAYVYMDAALVLGNTHTGRWTRYG